MPTARQCRAGGKECTSRNVCLVAQGSWEIQLHMQQARFRAKISAINADAYHSHHGRATSNITRACVPCPLPCRSRVPSYFAAHDAAILGRVDRLYQLWAGSHEQGPACSECRELSVLFSLGVDAVSSGQSTGVPPHLQLAGEAAQRVAPCNACRLMQVGNLSCIIWVAGQRL